MADDQFTYREVLISGWGTSRSRQRVDHYWQWQGGKKFQTICRSHFTRYRPAQYRPLTRCKACERKLAARKKPPE